MKPDTVLRVADLPDDSLHRLLGRYGLSVAATPDGQPIPGSFWGDDEAGLVGNALHLRPDTPVHSALHEACHYICMDHERRASLHTNAGGDHAEENAVCYLQLLLADAVAGFGRERALADMDAWGYSFRLGSARAWFQRDADDALAWLQAKGIVDAARLPTGALRQESGSNRAAGR